MEIEVRKSINRKNECCDVCKMRCKTIDCDCRDCVKCKKVSVCSYSYCYFNLPEGQEFSQSKICEILIRNFPTALHNDKMCKERLANANGWNDWLRENLNVCQKSSSYRKRFVENRCKDKYCKESKSNYEKWKTEYENKCTEVTKNENCKSLGNKIVAFKTMKCEL